MKLGVATLLLVAAGSVARGDQVRCEAVQRGRRVLARAELDGFFDREMLRLIRLGLEGRVRVDFRLVKRRVAWFDDELASFSQDLVVTWDAARRGYVMNGVAIHPSALDPLRIDRVPLGRRDPADYYVEVAAKVQVVTLKSLRGAARWIGGGAEDAGGVSRRLARIVVDDLVRKASSSCDVGAGP